ncbi:MAG: Transcriptional regulator, liaR family [Frankiales bacterium]|nr:Transcriptional regulator, liaR family [Frankiales bacterium]
MPDVAADRLELTEAAASSGPLRHRALGMLAALRRVVPFEGAWLALADPEHPAYAPLASADLSDSVLTFFGGPTWADDIEVAGTNRPAPPRSPSDLPHALEMPSWADCLIPAGFHNGLGVGLFAPGGRHIGFLALLFESSAPPSRPVRDLLVGLTSVLARGVDPMRSLSAAAGLVRGATAGVVLRAAGGVETLPGLGDHALLRPGSPVLDAARAAIDVGLVHTAFLWPMGGRHAPEGHVRITALASSEDVPARLVGMVLVAPPGELCGLTPRELEVLGLIIDGLSNREIARDLVVAQRTVAAHVEHILTKLDSSTRTHAAIRAQREGLYVPRQSPSPRPRA